MSGWRLPLRLARRDALRHRARSILVLVMITLPVLAVTAADVLQRTQSVSSVESLDRRLGAAAALVSVQQGIQHVEQGPDPEDGFPNDSGNAKAPMPTAAQLDGLLGGARLMEVRQADVDVRVPAGVASIQATEADLSDPLTRGLFRLTSGRLPRGPHEVVINAALADRGLKVGDRLDLDTDGAQQSGSANPAVPAPTVVGIAESTTSRTDPLAAGPLGAFGVDTSATRSWLVGGGPVSWATVRRLNDVGATVLSREVVEHPPPRSEIPAEVQLPGRDHATLAVLALVGIMALIEVVLLAGPAFAVGARRQQRSLALMVAAGGTPEQSRRVVMASALVLGGAASALGAVLGIGTARLLEPVLQARSDSYFGPFQVVGREVVAVAAFGLLSAFLAAVVPAWTASRQDVVAVLAGRRGDRRPSLRSPLLGLVLLGGGILGAVAGARGAGELLIAASAVPSVLGMVLLIPIVLAFVARLSGRFPLVLRYAVRDANRHRTRTVPAVAAVAATVAGVVALSIGLASDQKQNQETYTPQYPSGTGMVTSYSDTDWDGVAAVVRRVVPGATVRVETGLPDDLGTEYTNSTVAVPGGAESLLDGASGSLGAQLMVSTGPLPFGLVGLSATSAAAATDALSHGTSVAFVGPGRPTGASTVRLGRDVYKSDGSSRPVSRARANVPAVLVRVPAVWMGPLAILTPAAATQLQSAPTTVALAVTGAVISSSAQTTIAEGVAAVSAGASFYVERGYQEDSAYLIIRWILLGLGAVLMLGGTLTATFLALSDARPDLATLSAVGASPSTRRGVAGGYAVVVGVVGAVLGTAVGFIPGIAITYPLTGEAYSPAGNESVGPFLAIPWLTLALLIVALPLLTALVVTVCARSRLPLVARLD